MATSWFLILFPVLVLLYICTKHLLQKILNLPPSPFPSLPVIGHLHLLKKPLHRTLSALTAKQGPVLLLNFGSRRVLVVSSPSAAEDCLSENDVVFASRPRMAMGRHIGSNYTSLSWAPYGDHWRNLRRISAIELLSTHRLQTLADIRTDEIKIMLRRLLRGQDGPVDVKAALYELTTNIMMRMIAGKRYFGDSVKDVEEANKFRKIVFDTTQAAGQGNLGDYLPFMKRFSSGDAKMAQLQGRRDEFMQDLIEKTRTAKLSDDGSKSNNKTMVEVLLSLQEKEPEYYTDQIIRSLALVLFVGGTDTTATTMEWAFSLLINHPQVFNKAQAEIDSIVGHNRLVEESDLARLPYLNCIIFETMRMYPVVPLLLPHESSQECKIGGFSVPRGTMLLVNAWAIQNDGKTWKDPTKFKPERFQESILPVRDGHKLIPFGSGRRGCPGEALATRVVGLALASLIQSFTWESVDGKMVDMTERGGLTLSKAHPLRAVCRARPDMFHLLS